MCEHLCVFTKCEFVWVYLKYYYHIVLTLWHISCLMDHRCGYMTKFPRTYHPSIFTEVARNLDFGHFCSNITWTRIYTKIHNENCNNWAIFVVSIHIFINSFYSLKTFCFSLISIKVLARTNSAPPLPKYDMLKEIILSGSAVESTHPNVEVIFELLHAAPYLNVLVIDMVSNNIVPSTFHVTLHGQHDRFLSQLILCV